MRGEEEGKQEDWKGDEREQVELMMAGKMT